MTPTPLSKKKRLSKKTLPELAPDITRPDYDRSQTARVVHLGVGAFHKAHQAVYFDALMQSGEQGWMITGASLRSPRAAQQLAPQDGLYTVVANEGGQETLSIIASIGNIIAASQHPDALIAILAHPDTQLVTLTITEKGYCIDPSSQTLQAGHEGIAADIANPGAPVTAPGFLCAGLAARRVAGLRPFTILSCDNIPHNGKSTQAAVIGLAEKQDPALAQWIAKNTAFPSSMVDRIVPATTGANIDALAARHGYRDEAMVKTEPFSQWVVEDKFSGHRPPLEKVGVQMTDNVENWENAKLRLLNGAHSALAYLGALAGHEFVHQSIAAPGFEAFVDTLWDEAQTTIDLPTGFDPQAYRQQLKERFQNSALQHRTIQIAMDGSQKIPQRILDSIRARRKAGLPAPALIMAVAAWMKWQFGEDERGNTFTVDDPLAEQTRARVEVGAGDPAAIVKSLLGLRAVFSSGLAEDIYVRKALTSTLRRLMDAGAGAAIDQFLSEEK